MAPKSAGTSSFLTPKVMELIRAACKSAKARKEAIANPRALLGRRGIEVPADLEIRLYERKNSGKSKPGQDDVADPMFDTHLAEYKGLREVASPIDRWWRDKHEGCPFGTVPHKTTKTIEVCDLYVTTGIKTWVSDRDGTPFGHFEYTDTVTRCVQSHPEVVEVTECLPRLVILSENTG